MNGIIFLQKVLHKIQENNILMSVSKKKKEIFKTREIHKNSLKC